MAVLEGLTYWLDFDSWPSGSPLTSDDPSGIFLRSNGLVTASPLGAMHSSPMGFKLDGMTAAANFIIKVANRNAFTVEVTWRSFSNLPTASDRILIRANGCNISANLANNGAIRMVNPASTVVTNTKLHIDPTKSLRLQFSINAFGTTATTVIRGFYDTNIYGDVPDFILSADVPYTVIPSGECQIGAANIPAYIAYGDDVQLSNEAMDWAAPPGPPTVTALREYTFAGIPSATQMEVRSSIAGVTSADLAVSTSGVMASPTLIGAVSATANRIVKHFVPFSAPNTDFYLRYQTVGGVPFGPILGPYRSGPAAGTAVTRSIMVTSCQGNQTDPLWSDPSQPAFQKILDIAGTTGAHLIVQQGDFGYWGGTMVGTDPVSKHVEKYRKQLDRTLLMKSCFDRMPCIIQTSDHETSSNEGENYEFYVPPSGAPDWSAITRTAIDAYMEIVPVAAANYGDTRNPRKGRWFSQNLSDQILMVSIDFRSWERTLQSDADGASKKALGDLQMAWLATQLQRPEALKIVLSDVAFVPTDTWSALNNNNQHSDKWWSYQNSMRQVAAIINNPSTGALNLTTIGTPIQVEMWVGDRHALGKLAAANNTMADGTRCNFDVLLCSGSDKNGLTKVPGELYDADYGFVASGVMSEPRQFMHMLLTQTAPVAGHGTITRVANGWNCAPNPLVGGPQTYAPVQPTGLVNITKTYNY